MEFMSEQSPYEKLGVSEDASFEEVQTARDRLLEDFEGDRKLIETAYDAILMDRLRLRQEGKIKVPERIRFPDRLAEIPSSPPVTVISRSPAWLQRMLDTPSRNDMFWPGLIFLALSGLSIVIPMGGSPSAGLGVLQLALALGIGFSLYFLNRKENQFGRAFLLALGGLLAGLLAGSLLVSLLPAQATVAVSQEQIIAVFTFLILWLVSSFLR
jgi:hypothetical protein